MLKFVHGCADLNTVTNNVGENDMVDLYNLGPSRRNPATSGAKTAQTSASTSSAAISTSTSSSSTSSSSSSTSKAEAKKITDLYQGQLEYKKALVDGATGDDKIRFQKQLDNLNVKILTLTQAATSSPEEKAQLQTQIDAINSKNRSTTTTTTTKATTVANTGAAKSSTSSSAASGTTAFTNTPSVSAFGPEALKEVKSFLRQVEYFETIRDGSTSSSVKYVNQVKINDANVNILKVELKYAGTPKAKAEAQAKIDIITASSVHPYSCEVDYYTKLRDGAKSQDVKAINQVKIDTANLNILNIQLRYATTPEVKAEVQTKIDNINKTQKALMATATNADSSATSTTASTQAAKAVPITKAAIDLRLAEITKEYAAVLSKTTALVAPKLTSISPTEAEINKYSAAMKEYKAKSQALADDNKVLKSEESQLKAKLTSIATTTSSANSSVTTSKTSTQKSQSSILGAVSTKLGEIKNGVQSLFN